jgi:hypothetical protein
VNASLPVRALFIAASIVVIALLFISDYAPREVNLMSEIRPEDERVQLVCLLQDVRQRENGCVLALRDASGSEVLAFVSDRLIEDLPSTGSLVEVRADVSWENGLFLFVREIRKVI